MLTEILSVNLPTEMKPYRMESRFVYYSNPNELSEPMSFPEARRGYMGLGDEGHLAFLADDPVPSVLSRRKQK